ncbi:hypothetical protein B224_2334 [Aeromonas media WS]|nr:hypothetical protein B224_2334 [Aeromonas media WS]
MVCCMAHRCIPLPMLLFVFRPVIGAIFTPDLQNPLVNIC